MPIEATKVILKTYCRCVLQQGKGCWCVSLHCLPSKQALPRRGPKHVWQYLPWSVWTRTILAQTCLSRVIHHNLRAAFTLWSTQVWTFFFFPLFLFFFFFFLPQKHRPSQTIMAQHYTLSTAISKQATSSRSVKQVFRNSWSCDIKFITQQCYRSGRFALEWSAVIGNTADIKTRKGVQREIGRCLIIWHRIQQASKLYNLGRLELELLPPIGWVSSVSVILLGLENKPSDGGGSNVKIHFFTGTHQHAWLRKEASAGCS